MALPLATWNLEYYTALQLEVRRKRLQLIVRLHAFHGEPAGIFIAEMASPVGKIL